MLLFSREVTLSGSYRQVLPWAIGITEYVNGHSPLEVSCWTANFGHPIGTMGWSAVVESEAELAGATAALIGDSGYLDRLEVGADMTTTPGRDVLRSFVHGPSGDAIPVGAVASVTTATAMVDRLAEAIGWAVEIGAYVEGVVDAPLAVLTDVYGTMGGMAWITVQPDMAAAEAARGKLGADPGYIAKLVESKGVFIPGTGHVAQLTRIA